MTNFLYLLFCNQLLNICDTGIRFKDLLVKEALDIAFGDAENDNDDNNPLEAVIITPPDAGLLTDEEPWVEENPEVDNLSRYQLMSEVEVIRLYPTEKITTWEKNLG